MVVRRRGTAGAGVALSHSAPLSGGAFSRAPLFSAPIRARRISGALENATVCRLKFAVANFTPPVGGGVWLAPNDGKP